MNKNVKFMGKYFIYCKEYLEVVVDMHIKDESMVVVVVVTKEDVIFVVKNIDFTYEFNNYFFLFLLILFFNLIISFYF